MRYVVAVLVMMAGLTGCIEEQDGQDAHQLGEEGIPEPSVPSNDPPAPTGSSTMTGTSTTTSSPPTTTSTDTMTWTSSPSDLLQMTGRHCAGSGSDPLPWDEDGGSVGHGPFGFQTHVRDLATEEAIVEHYARHGAVEAIAYFSEPADPAGGCAGDGWSYVLILSDGHFPNAYEEGWHDIQPPFSCGSCEYIPQWFRLTDDGGAHPWEPSRDAPGGAVGSTEPDNLQGRSKTTERHAMTEFHLRAHYPEATDAVAYRADTRCPERSCPGTWHYWIEVPVTGGHAYARGEYAFEPDASFAVATSFPPSHPFCLSPCPDMPYEDQWWIVKGSTSWTPPWGAPPSTSEHGERNSAVERKLFSHYATAPHEEDIQEAVAYKIFCGRNSLACGSGDDGWRYHLLSGAGGFPAWDIPDAPWSPRDSAPNCACYP